MRRWLLEVELLSQRTQILALFPFFIRIEAGFLELMIGDGTLHSLDNEIDPLLNLRGLLSWTDVLALFIFFRLIACVRWRSGLFCWRRALV